MRTVFASIVLNEEQYLGANLAQHYEYCDQWIIVEGSVEGYPRDRLTENGLSTDQTAEIVRSFPDPDKKIHFIQAGSVQNKEVLRSVYAEAMPGGTHTVIVFDADEFLRHKDLEDVLDRMKVWRIPGALRIPHLHFWRDPQQIVRGGYYDVPHNRIYRWARGARYVKNHNHPERPDGVMLHSIQCKTFPLLLQPVEHGWCHPTPAFLHYGFCKSKENMQDKTDYYVARGEEITRPLTIRNRRAWFYDGVPDGCELLPWAGGQPEVFRHKEGK